MIKRNLFFKTIAIMTLMNTNSVAQGQDGNPLLEKWSTPFGTPPFSQIKNEHYEPAIKAAIKEKEGDLKGNMASEGTTPRRLTDLIGSLCDLTSGSGDKGTPIVYIQGYFDNYTTD